MVSGQFWNAIHGAISWQDMQPAGDTLNHEQRDLALKYGIQLDEVYFVQNSLQPWVWFREGFSVDLSAWHDEIFKMMRIRERIEAYIQLLDEVKQEDNYIKWFIHMDKKFIIPMLVKIYQDVPKEKLYDLFEDVWTRSEFGFEQFTPDMLRYIFKTRRLSKLWQARMRKFRKLLKERNLLVTGPDGKQYLQVFHGEQNQELNPGDMCSWTLSEKVAQFFAYRFDNYEYGEVQERMIQPKEALDYLDCRNEDEVLLWPEEWGKM